MNSLSQILKGSPFLQYHLLKKSFAKLLMLCEVEHGTSWMLAPNLSVTVSKQSKPSSGGKGLIKSMATESPCSVSTGKK
jgi:hypothetical protein